MRFAHLESMSDDSYAVGFAFLISKLVAQKKRHAGLAPS